MWRHFHPTEVLFGEKMSIRLGEIMEKNGFDKAVMVCDPFTESCGVAEKLTQAAGGKIVGRFSDIEPNPSVKNVDGAADVIRGCGAGCVIAVGGGSAIDCAKSAAAAAAMNVSGREILDGKPITQALPIIALSTTAGTGSEVTAVSILSDKETGEKGVVASPLFFPKVAIVDPELTYTCPPKVTASSGIDVLMHALDALSSVKSTPVTDALAVKAARLVFRYLPVAYRNGGDTEARRHMCTASIVAGLAFSITGTTGSHACSYHLTGAFGIPHGEACAFTADAWYRLNAEARPELNDFAREIGFADAGALADALNVLKREVGLRCTLSEAGIAPERIGEIAQFTVEASNWGNNVNQVSTQRIEDFLRNKI
ncbi:MAG: iron-containing alcohol dehydrogenase [Candidatus Heteroscillospira sp.]|jgi:alcohol dehydrogenase class IV